MQRSGKDNCQFRKWVMKIVCLLLMVTMMSVSCGKKSGADRGLAGTWNLVEVRGMHSTTDIPEAWRETISFEGNSYTFKTGDSTESGTYTTAEDGSVEKEVCLVMEPGRYSRTILFSGGSSDKKIFYEFSDDTLKTISGCFAYDGGVEKIYRRGVVN